MVTVHYMHLLCDQTAITTGDAADMQIGAMEGVGRKEQEEKKQDRRRKEGREEGRKEGRSMYRYYIISLSI